MRVILITGLILSVMLSACGGEETAIVVNEDAPVLGTIANISEVAGNNINFQASAEDPTGDTLVYALTPASFFVGKTSTPVFTAGGSFSWDTTESDVGSYTVTVTVADSSGLTDSQSVRITVTTSVVASAGETLFNNTCTGSSCHGGNQNCLPWGAGEITDALSGGATPVGAMSGISLSSGQISDISTYAIANFQSGCP